MRVVFLTHNYPRFTGDVAGSFLHPLARALMNRGHDVRVVAPSDAGRGGADRLDGVPVRRVRYASADRECYAYSGRMQETVQSIGGLLALGGLIRALRKGAEAELAGAGDDAVVHAHWWFPSGIAVPSGVSAVVTLHGTDARLLERGFGARFLARRALRQPRIITAVSTAVAGRLARAGFGPIGPERIQPMPVPVGAPAPSAGGAGAVTVARLTKQKRVELAIEAIAVLARRDRRVALTIAGDGPERAALERTAAALGVSDRIRWLGALPPDRIPELFTRADVAVIPSKDEGFGMVAIEALAGGVPILVCRDGGGLLDVLTVAGAGLATEPTAEAIAEAMARTIDDPAARGAAMTAGTTWLGRLTPEAVAARCEVWYRESRRG